MGDLFDAFWEDVGELDVALSPVRANLDAGLASPADRDALARYAHTLKASAGYVDLAGLEAAAQTLERAAATATPSALLAAIGAVDDALTRAGRPDPVAASGVDLPGAAGAQQARALVHGERHADVETHVARAAARDHNDAPALSFASLCAPLLPAAAAAARAGAASVDVVVIGGDVDVPAPWGPTLREALIECVRNAARHGVEPPAVRAARGKPERGRVVVSATRTAEALGLTVSDDGGGLDAARLTRAAARAGAPPGAHEVADPAALAVTPGVTTAGGAKAIGGSGLGLAIVADAVARLGGRLDLESRSGHGLTVRTTLPLAAAAAADPPGGRRVLVIEDDAFFRGILSPLLAAAGYSVTAIDGADGAWALAAEGVRFDAVVTDLDGAAGGGLAFARAIADDPAWAGAARLGLTTHFAPRSQATEGLHDTIAKSDRASLLAALARVRAERPAA